MEPGLSAIMNQRTYPTAPGHSRQHGVVLVIALIVLVAMTLVAIGTLRSVDTGNLIAGNLGFKQATLNSSDVAVDTAYRWLVSNSSGTTLTNDATANGYLSSVPSAEPNWTDASDAIWNTAVCMNNCTPDATYGNTMRYVIHRLCTQANTAYNGTGANGQANQCHMSTGSSDGSGDSKIVNSQSPCAYTPCGVPQLYYRITAKVVGPHNAVSIVQAVVAI
jgi:Tfp pilus assembly protein PilX